MLVLVPPACGGGLASGVRSLKVQPAKDNIRSFILQPSTQYCIVMLGVVGVDDMQHISFVKSKWCD